MLVAATPSLITRSDTPKGHARSGTDGFLAEWLGENRLGWAADLIADLTNITPQTDPEARP